MKLILFIALLFLVTAGRVQAVQLTLDECIEKALQGNSGLKIYETEVTAGEEEVKIARAALFPSVRVKALYSLIDEPERLLVERDAFTSGIPAQDVELTTGNRDFYNVSLIVEQPLFTGGRLAHSVGKSKTIEEEATIAVQRQRKLLRGKVRQAFYDLLNASLSSDFARKIADAKQERLRVIRERHREGYSAADEVTRAEADVAYSELELRQALNREQLAASELRKLAYLPAAEKIEPLGKPVNVSLAASLEEVLQTMLRNREELKVAELRMQRADDDIAIARSDYYPQASLQGIYTQQKETNIVRPEVWMLVARLDWSLFEWGKTRADVGRKLAHKQRAHYELEEIQRAVALEAEQAWLTVVEKAHEVKAFQKQLQAKEAGLATVHNKYAEGEVKLVDLIEAEAEFSRSFNSYLMSVNELNAAVSRLDVAVSGASDAWFRTEELYVPVVKVATGAPQKKAVQPPSVPRVTKSIVANPAPSSSVEEKPAIDNVKVSPALSAQAEPTAPPATDVPVRYVIQPKEHLFKILVTRFGLTYPEANAAIPAIIRLNSLQNVDQLKAGEVLLLPPSIVKTKTGK